MISLVAFLASLAIVAASLPELKALFLPVAALLPFCLPVYGNFQQGQLTMVLVFLVTASWALDRSGPARRRRGIDRPGRRDQAVSRLSSRSTSPPGAAGAL